MGLDFSALIQYGGPSREILPVIACLERGEEDAAFQQVVAVGLRRGFAFAERAGRKAAWRLWSDIEQEIPQRPDLPSLDLSLDLPSDFSLTFGHDAVWVYHTLRWHCFVTEVEWQRVMLSAVRWFCQSLGTADCIIAHDCHPAVLAFQAGASYQQALRIAEDKGEGAVSSIGDLYIDRGYADDLVYLGPGGEELAIPLWDTHGFWRFKFGVGDTA